MTFQQKWLKWGKIFLPDKLKHADVTPIHKKRQKS